MKSLFRLVKRLSFTIHRVMEFGGQPLQNLRSDEAHALMFGSRLGGPAYPHHQQLPPFIPRLPYPPGDFHAGRRECSRGRRRNWAWVLGAFLLIVLVASGTVFGLLFALKEFKSPLLCSGLSQDVLAQNRHTGCVPCPGQIDGSGHKCCPTTNHTELQKHKPNIKEGQPHISTPGEDSSSSSSNPRECGALYYLRSVNEAGKPGLDPTVVRGWDSTGSPAAYQTPCIVYENSTGEFKISISGYYVIYSHLAFKWIERGTRSNIINQKVIARQIIIGNGPGPSNTMASDRRAIQKDDPGVGDIPSYNSRVTAVIPLHKDTVLTIKAEPIDLLLRDNDYSTFGIFKL